MKYCICVCKCGDEVCVSIIDCENDIPSGERKILFDYVTRFFLFFQDTKELDTAGGREIPCNAKCFVDGDTCVAVIDCCNDLPEKPKNYVYAVKCNGKIFKSQCGGAKSFKCTCKCSLNGSSCDVSLDCCRGNIGKVFTFKNRSSLGHVTFFFVNPEFILRILSLMLEFYV